MGDEPFFGKLMLFGEYSVIVGSMALVVPLKHFSGQWVNDLPSSEQQFYLKEELLKYYTHLSISKEAASILDLDKLTHALENDWWIDANIPVGYGVGSSGIVVAALYAGFGKEKTGDLNLLKTQLGQLENYFHGNSSGIDPLCCLKRKAVKIGFNQEIRIVDGQLPPQGWKLFLFDSMQQGMTAPLVQHFNRRMQDYSFFKKVKNEWIPSVNQAIESYLSSNPEEFAAALKAVSRFERLQLPAMIPEKVMPYWDSGLKNNLFFMKLCGSGGGGYNLVFTQNESETLKAFPAERLIPIV